MKNIESRLESLEMALRASQGNAEHIKAVEYLARWYESKKRLYNSPDEVERREQWHKELDRVGKLRKSAFERGELWDKYPLPKPLHTLDKEKSERIKRCIFSNG